MIVCLAIALGAMVSQGAAVNWLIDTPVKEQYGFNRYDNIYIFASTFDSSKLSSANESDWASALTGAISTSEMARKLGDGSLTGVTSDTYLTFVIIGDGVEEGGTPANGMNYWVSDAMQVGSLAYEGNQSALGFLSPTTFTAGTFTAGTTPTPGEGTPEPTSGLLMIVGGALLTLRRKQK